MSYNWQTLQTTAPSAEILNAALGVYEIEVVAINGVGARSGVTTLTRTVSGTSVVPPNVTGASIVPVDETTGLLSWDTVSDVNVTVGGKVMIRHQPVMTGASWESSTQIVPFIPGAQSASVVPLLEGTYLLKFTTNNSVRSSGTSTTTITLPTPQPRLNIASIDEASTGFSGTASGMYYSPERGGLTIDGSTLFDAVATDNNFDALGTIDSLGGVSTSGEYVFAQATDLGAIYDVNLTRRLAVLPFNVAALFDDNLGDLDTWGDLDGVDVTDTNALLYVRSTNDDPSGSPTWSEWRICTNNMLRGRGFQFKVVAFSEQISQNVVISQLGVLIELQQRVEHSTPLTSDSGIDGLALDDDFDALATLDTLSTFTVAFSSAFYDTPSINVTAFTMDSGDYFTLSNVGPTNFQVTFFNSGGDLVSRQFTHTSVGHGRRI
jgi:hypothetical protein